MKINKIEKILQSNDAKQKLKKLGENPADLKASKDSLVIIYDDKTYEIKMVNTLTHKRKIGPGEGGKQKPSTRELLASFIEQQTKFNAKVDAFITKQEEFNQKVDLRIGALDNKLSNVITNNNLRFDALENKLSNVVEKNNLKV